MTGDAAPKRGRGAPRKDVAADPRRFAAVFVVAAVRAQLVPSERAGSMFAAVIFSPEGRLALVPKFQRPGRWSPVAGNETGRQMPDIIFNAVGATGRRSIKVESYARAIRRTKQRIEATPGGTVWLSKCAKWLAVCLTTREPRAFDFAAYNLMRLGFERAALTRIASGFARL